LPFHSVILAADEEFDAHGFGVPRTEQEERLAIPVEKVQEVWSYLQNRYVTDIEHLQKMDPLFSSYASEEDFSDTYFDTSKRQLLQMQGGVRHRKRINLTNPEDPKSGRELIQLKVSGVSNNQLERGEMKFEVKYYDNKKSIDDLHPMLGIVKRSQRDQLKSELTRLGLDPYDMSPVLTIKDRRRRVYILKDKKPFISISLDHATSEVGGKKAEFAEVEEELNEIAFTEASAETKQYMESINAIIINDLKEKFPDIKQDLTPKYNRVYKQLETKGAFRKGFWEFFK
jgi:adenylate cyclase class IV